MGNYSVFVWFKLHYKETIVMLAEEFKVVCKCLYGCLWLEVL